jgi:hypothetical protein
VISSSNGSRAVTWFWGVWSEAWSSVAVSCAWAEAVLRMLATRVEPGTEGLWKRVITSRVLCCREHQFESIPLRLVLTMRNMLLMKGFIGL